MPGSGGIRVVGTSGEERGTYAPSKEEVLAAVESLAHPSPLDAVAAAVDALRRSQARSGGQADRVSSAAGRTFIEISSRARAHPDDRAQLDACDGH